MSIWNSTNFDGVEWNNINFLNMFIDAINERQYSVYQMQHVASGDSVQIKTFIQTLQNRIMSNIYYIPTTYVWNTSTYPQQMTMGNWFAVLGRTQNGFKKIYTDGSIGYGVIGEGDQIGPHLFTEMRDILNLQVREWEQVSGASATATAINKNKSSLYNADWATAKTNADAGNETTLSNMMSSTWGIWHWGSWYEAGRNRYSANISHVASIGNGGNWDATLRFTLIPITVWDDGGSGYPQNTWIDYDAFTGTGANAVVRELTLPNVSWCPEPYNALPYPIAFAQGMQVQYTAIDRRHDIAGGFQYTSATK